MFHGRKHAQEDVHVDLLKDLGLYHCCASRLQQIVPCVTINAGCRISFGKAQGDT